jgi:flagellar biosynthesis protein FlhB
MNRSEGDRIHPPTPRRRQFARQQGHVARSRDLVAAGVFLAAVAAVWMQGSDVTYWIGRLAVEHLSGDVRVAADSASAVDLGRQTLFQLGTVMLPVLGLLLLAAVISQVGQFGILFVPEKLTPDPQRLNPIAHGQRLVAADNWVRTGLGILKLVAVMTVAGWSLWSLRWEIMSLGIGDANTMAVGAVSVFSTVALRVLAAVVILALADFTFQYWYHERQLWMTEEERREESRDEQTGSRFEHQRRQRRHQIAQGAFDPEIARADVVLIAGNSLAVALAYDPTTMPAPRVLAKGTGSAAVEIYRLAQRHGKWIVDERKLARELVRRVPAGQELPPDMYRTVARLLADLPRYASSRTSG